MGQADDPVRERAGSALERRRCPLWIGIARLRSNPHMNDTTAADPDPEGAQPALDTPARVLLERIPQSPGVYRMLDAHATVLYVGKAKNLKRRVTSYFGRTLTRRLQVMVSQIADIEVTVTRTEGEALLLESNLIKSLRPRFNVLLRDDKSYPYHLSQHAGRVSRGSPSIAVRARDPGRFFGPYPSAWAVRETLQLLQKLFPGPPVRRQLLPQPLATLSAISDQALQRTLCRSRQPGGLCGGCRPHHPVSRRARRRRSSTDLVAPWSRRPPSGIRAGGRPARSDRDPAAGSSSASM